MSNVISPPAPTLCAPRSGMNLGTKLILAGWLALVVLLGATDAFTTPPGEPPLSILFGVLCPLFLYFAAYRWSARFHAYVLGADLTFLTGVQAWRFVGFGFLALYSHGILPGIFAWPAGIGDVLIALSAPWIALRLARLPAYAASGRYRAWNLLGILDLMIAVGVGALSSYLAVGSEITARPMAQMPLVLVPGFFVPLFVMLHVTALLQARQLRQLEKTGKA